MKLSRKVIAGISAAAAIVVAGTVAGCKKDDEDPYQLIALDGDNASIDATNDGSLAEGESASEDDKVATSPTFVRGFKTPSTMIKKKAALYKLTIHKDSKSGVLGWIFDEEKFEAASTGNSEDTYSFFLLGLKATEGSPSIYLSRFNNVAQSGLSGSANTFGTEYTMIDSGQTDSSQAASKSKWYYKLDANTLGTGNEVKYDPTTGNASIIVGYKQITDGRYILGIFKCNTATAEADKKAAEDWYNNNKAPATGYTEVRLIRGNFNAVNTPSGGKLFTTQYDDATANPAVSNTIENFGTTAAGTARSTNIGFYAMIPAKGSLKGKWEWINWDKFEDEAVEE